jgi:tRNA threonylcarbamoyl adenosine modification protein YeaZ
LPAEPPAILGFDTSAAQCAAALVQGGATLARRIEAMQQGQAERLLPMLEEVLAEAGVPWGGLGALAVCTGPGNFTGVRIAVAAARGLALALGVPAVGVTLFEALADGRQGRVLVTLEDRRGGVFAQTLDDGAPSGAPALADPASLPLQPAGTLCLGFRAGEIAERLGLAAGPEAVRADPAALARLAAGRLDPLPPRPAPLYLRPADAMPPAESSPRILDDV